MKKFWLLLSSCSLSNFADGLSLSILPIFASSILLGVTNVAMMSLFRFLPWILIGIFSGPYIDQYNRKKIIVISMYNR